MEKLTSLLLVADHVEHTPAILDKALRLARLFGARLEALTTTAADERAFEDFRARQSLGSLAVRHGVNGAANLQEAILRRVADSHPDLVIKPFAGPHPLRRWTLDENDWLLARQCPVPLLLARETAWADPPVFAAAVDIADRDDAGLARRILQTAGFLALGMHGHLDVLYSESETRDQALRMERTVLLSQLVREFHMSGDYIRRFEGEARHTLTKAVSSRAYDVLVLGARSRSEGMAGLIPGTTSRLIDASRGDVLLVNPRESLAAGRGAASSLRQQRAYQGQEPS